MIKVAIMGFGTIGSGVAEVLDINKKSIAARVGDEVELKYVLDLRDFEGDPIQEKIVHDYKVIAEDPEVAIVVETMGGVEPAYTFVKTMLEAGKHVTTSNKALVAAKGAELIALAKEKNVNFMFEASVGGGIPIIRPLNSCLTADEIEEITGIVNGTTNYMMTEMTEKGADFNEVLKDAQAKGYAEKDPTADVEGYDACRKIAILSSLAYGHHVDFEEIYTEGITKITSADIRYAKAFGATIKLLASSKRIGDKYYAMVCPVMINGDSPLFSVNDVFNAIVIHGNMLGDAMFYGSGAGKLPTASAVVGDMISAVRFGDEPEKIGWSSEKLEVHPAAELSRKYFARFEGSERAKKEAVAAAFGDVKFVTPEGTDEFAVLTGEMTGEEFDAAAAKVGGLRQKIAARL